METHFIYKVVPHSKTNKDIDEIILSPSLFLNTNVWFIFYLHEIEELRQVHT